MQPALQSLVEELADCLFSLRVHSTFLSSERAELRRVFAKPTLYGTQTPPPPETTRHIPSPNAA